MSIQQLLTKEEMSKAGGGGLSCLVRYTKGQGSGTGRYVFNVESGNSPTDTFHCPGWAWGVLCQESVQAVDSVAWIAFVRGSEIVPRRIAWTGSDWLCDPCVGFMEAGTLEMALQSALLSWKCAPRYNAGMLTATRSVREVPHSAFALLSRANVKQKIGDSRGAWAASRVE